MKLCMEGNKNTMNSVRRLLTYECHGIFCKSQAAATINNAALRLDEVELLSQSYRLAIQKSLKFLEYSNEYDIQTKEEIGNDLLSAQIILSLFEAVSMRPTDNSIVIDLIEWGRECAFPPSSDILAAVMDEISTWEAHDKPETHQLYWNALCQQVLCGKLKDAASLLQYHSKHSSDIILQKIVRILQKIEFQLISNKRSCEDFVEIQKEIRLLRSELSPQYYDLKFLCSILLGEPATFEQCSLTFTMRWYELLPTYLLFAYPLSKIGQVGNLAKKLFMLVEKDKTESDIALLDKILFAILTLNCLEALKLICSAGPSSWWLATHLVDLLFYHDANILAISSKTNHDDLDLRTRIVTEYANTLFATDGLWDIAADYLMASGSENVLQDLNDRMSELDWKKNTQLVERFLVTCDRYDLFTAKTNITRAVTAKFLNDKEWSSALCWALRNGSVELISQVAHKVLYYSEASEIAQMRIFDSISESFLITPELLILWKFYNYKKCTLHGQLKEAITILHDLFIDNSAPDNFFVTLLHEMLRLLSTFNISHFSTTANFNKNAVLNLLGALSKFEFFYSVRSSADNITPENEQTKESINELLMLLRPTLLNTLSMSYFSSKNSL